ncbi:uncharacterized protein LOC110234671 [Exaiptasia diaphana]|nr:uncharacterized protein LOC110234671 [Exaiptasia diaphana]KXJ20812.1 hypothetical protein AC249_AIPGENE15681 [Exaiptasia diaphana]
MRMKNIKSTTTDDKEQQDTDNSYERLSHIAPRREVPEQYDELNRSSQPSSTNNMSLPENDPENFYHVLEGTDQSVDDETMYQVIDKDPCEDDLYERNVLYDNVA